MPYTTQEFAAEIKRKYPEYASWPDDHLVSEMVKKHPEYQSWLSGGSTPLTTMDDLAAQKGPVRRFAESAVQTLNPIPLAKKLLTAETYTEPFTTMAKVPGDLRKGNYLDAVEHGTRLVPTMTGETIGQRIGKARAAGDAARRGDTGEAISRSVGALPGGGVAEGVIDQARSGDVAGAAGTVTGLVLGPKAIERGIPLARRAVLPTRESAAASYGRAFNPEGPNAAKIPDVSSELANRRVTFSDPKELALSARINRQGAMDARPVNPREVQFLSDAERVAKDTQIPKAPPSAGRDLLSKAAKVIPGHGMIERLKAFYDSPAYATMTGVAKNDLARFIDSGNTTEVLSLLARAQQIYNASQDPRQRYIDHLIGGGSAP